MKSSGDVEITDKFSAIFKEPFCLPFEEIIVCLFVMLCSIKFSRRAQNYCNSTADMVNYHSYFLYVCQHSKGNGGERHTAHLEELAGLGEGYLETWRDD